MKIIFSSDALPEQISQSLFLAGPSIRDFRKHDWRHDALKILRDIGYKGTVFIPIPENVFYGISSLSGDGYDNQIKWECNARKMSDIILFWVNRNLAEGVMGLTTNFELGHDLETGRVVYGRPDDADKCRYLDRCVKAAGLPVFNDMKQTIEYAVSKLFACDRSGAEVFIPSMLWRLNNFQNWLQNQKNNGNRLDDADVISVYGNPIFSFAVKVNIFVASENRNKDNEIIFSRPDITTIIPYFRDGHDIKFVMIKEFRSPCCNKDGMIYEFPGGSGSGPENAIKELEEETGLLIDVSRIHYIGKHQLASTFSIHSSETYGVELTHDEFHNLRQDAIHDGTEITYVEVVSLQDIFKRNDIDYSMLGMVAKLISQIQ